MGSYIRWYSPNAKDKHYQDFSFKDGLVLEENLSEMLDSGVVVLNRKPKIDFEPFDKVQIVDDIIGSKLMLIDNIVETQIAFEPDLYDYTINLMSLTKSLERTVLPNFSITKPLNETARTIRNVISRLLIDYAPESLLKYTNVFGFTYAIHSYDVGSKEDMWLRTPCPDIQMNKPTLREAIDRILSTVGCICRLNENNEIELVKIDKPENAREININVVKQLNYINENQSSSDYASELDNEYSNVTPNNSIDNMDNLTRVTEYIGFRNSNDGIIAENDLQLETKFPIYNIEKIIMCVPVQTRNDTEYLMKLDITDVGTDHSSYVKEIQEWNLLSTGDILSVDTTTPQGPVKINTVYYTRGDNKILNWSANKKLLFRTNYVIEELIKDVSRQNVFLAYHLSDIDYRKDCSFIITYQAQVDRTRAKSGKLLPETHENNALIDNASEAFVDIYQQGKLFNDKVNRLGNRVKVITGRFKNEDRHLMPALGDYIGDFVVMNIEKQYYENFIVYKATLTENFVNVNYFTGINARKRSWQIVGAGEAFDKQLLDKYYCEFSFNKKQSYDNENIGNYMPEIYAKTNRLAYLLNGIKNNAVLPIKSIFVTNNYIAEQSNQVSFIELECQKFISGNSLLFTFGMLDNFSSTYPSLIRDQRSSSPDPSDFDMGSGGLKEYWNRYTDDKGNCDYYHILFVTDVLKPAQGYAWQNQIDKLTNMEVNSSELYSEFADAEKTKYINLYQGFKPRVYYPTTNGIYDFSNGEVLFTTSINNRKDNREKVNFNIQFEFCTDTKDIVFTKEFLRRQMFITTEPIGNDSYDIYVSDEKFNYGDTILKGHLFQVSRSNLNIETPNVEDVHKDSIVKYSFNTTEHHNHKSIAIVKKDTNELIMAVNTESDEVVWYLNILKTRDRKLYKNRSMTEWDYTAEPVATLVEQDVDADNYIPGREYVVKSNLEAENIGRLTQKGKLVWCKRDKTTLEILDSLTGLDTFTVKGNVSRKAIDVRIGSVIKQEITFEDYNNADYYWTIEFETGGTAGYNQQIAYDNFIGYIDK